MDRGQYEGPNALHIMWAVIMVIVGALLGLLVASVVDIIFERLAVTDHGEVVGLTGGAVTIAYWMLGWGVTLHRRSR